VHHDQREQYIQDALSTLRQAIAAGWKDAAHAKKDPDLAPLRDRDKVSVRYSSFFILISVKEST
jgi:hypothetical protein